MVALGSLYSPLRQIKQKIMPFCIHSSRKKYFYFFVVASPLHKGALLIVLDQLQLAQDEELVQIISP